MRLAFAWLAWAMTIWGFAAADGPWAAPVFFGFGLAMYAIYRHWAGRQPHKALVMAQEIAHAMRERSGLDRGDTTAVATLAVE